MPTDRSAHPPSDAVGSVTGALTDLENGVPGAHRAVFRLFQQAEPFERQRDRDGTMPSLSFQMSTLTKKAGWGRSCTRAADTSTMSLLLFGVSISTGYQLRVHIAGADDRDVGGVIARRSPRAYCVIAQMLIRVKRPVRTGRGAVSAPVPDCKGDQIDASYNQNRSRRECASLNRIPNRPRQLPTSSALPNTNYRSCSDKAASRQERQGDPVRDRDFAVDRKIREIVRRRRWFPDGRTTVPAEVIANIDLCPATCTYGPGAGIFLTNCLTAHACQDYR
jgi:hypothetical protein